MYLVSIECLESKLYLKSTVVLRCIHNHKNKQDGNYHIVFPRFIREEPRRALNSELETITKDVLGQGKSLP